MAHTQGICLREFREQMGTNKILGMKNVRFSVYYFCGNKILTINLLLLRGGVIMEKQLGF